MVINHVIDSNNTELISNRNFSDHAKCNIVNNASQKVCCRRTLNTEGKIRLCETHLRLAAYYKRRGLFLKQEHKKRSFAQASRLVFGKFIENRQVGRFETSYKSFRSFDEYSEDFPPLQSIHECESMPNDIVDGIIDQPDYLLKNAGVFRTEEVIKSALENLFQLRQAYKVYYLYLAQKFKHVRKGKMREIEQELEKYGPLYLLKNDPNGRSFELLRAMKRHKVASKKKLLLKTERNLKLSAKEDNNDQKSMNICQYKSTESSEISCENDAFPLSKFCKNHILADEKQVFFQKCETLACSEIVFKPNVFCLLHC